MTQPTYAPRPKESGHWYDPRMRRLVETVPYAKPGTSGPPDLRHARKLGLVPGVTTITSCAAAWGLERWKREQVLMAALTATRTDGETDKSFIARIVEDSEAQAAEARDTGTAIHALVQAFYTDGTLPENNPVGMAHVQGVDDAIRNVWGERLWTAEKCVSHSLGYATKVDLYCSNPLSRVIIDFKSKDFEPSDTANLATYDDHAMQLAAGAIASAGPHEGIRALDGIQAAIVYVSRTCPGLSWPVEVSELELRRGWQMFCALLEFWQAKNRYDSSWKENP